MAVNENVRSRSSCSRVRLTFFDAPALVMLPLLASVILCSAARPETPWKLGDLQAAPRVFPAAPHEAGMRAFFFEGLLWKGKPTRVFAWYGLPAHKESKRVPAIVLVHGGSSEHKSAESSDINAFPQ